MLGAHQGALGGHDTSLLMEGGSEVLGGDGETGQAAAREAGSGSEGHPAPLGCMEE